MKPCQAARLDVRLSVCPSVTQTVSQSVSRSVDRSSWLWFAHATCGLVDTRCRLRAWQASSRPESTGGSTPHGLYENGDSEPGIRLTGPIVCLRSPQRFN